MLFGVLFGVLLGVLLDVLLGVLWMYFGVEQSFIFKLPLTHYFILLIILFITPFSTPFSPHFFSSCLFFFSSFYFFTGHLASTLRQTSKRGVAHSKTVETTAAASSRRCPLHLFWVVVAPSSLEQFSAIHAVRAGIYDTCWLYSLCNFQYRQQYENTCSYIFGC